MKLRYLPSPEVPDLLLREMIEFLLAGFTPALEAGGDPIQLETNLSVKGEGNAE